MGRFADIVGVLGSTFGIGPSGARAILDASGLTAPRALTLPDAAGMIARVEDVSASSVIPVVSIGVGAVLSDTQAGAEAQYSGTAGTFNFDAIHLSPNARGLIRNIGTAKMSFAACPANVANRLRVATMVSAGNTQPTLPSGFTAFTAAVNGAVLGTAVTTASDPDTISMPTQGTLLDCATTGNGSAADIDAVSYTASQNLTMPANTFTPNGVTAASSGGLVFLIVGMATSASGVSSMDFETPAGWTLYAKRLGFRSAVAIFQMATTATAGAIAAPQVTTKVVSSGSPLYSVCAAMLVTKSTVWATYGASGFTSVASSAAVPRPGGAILKSSKATPSLSTQNALVAWSAGADSLGNPTNVVYLNGELDP